MSPKRVAEAGGGATATLDLAIVWVTAQAQGPERRKRDPNVRCLHPPKGRRRKEERACRAQPGLASPSTDTPGSWSWSCRRVLFVVLGEEWMEGRSGWASEGNCRNRVFRIEAWMRMHPPCQRSGRGWASERSRDGGKGGSERRGHGDVAAGGRLGMWGSSGENWVTGRPECD